MHQEFEHIEHEFTIAEGDTPTTPEEDTEPSLTQEDSDETAMIGMYSVTHCSDRSPARRIAPAHGVHSN